jgi:hypothetical protein
MRLITDPERIPDEKYHTLSVSDLDGDDYLVIAIANGVTVGVVVGSVGIGRDGEAAGFSGGEVHLDAADSWFDIEYVDFTDEYGYDEVQVTFEERSR